MNIKKITFGLLAGIAGTLLISVNSPSHPTVHASVNSTINRQINHMSWRQKIGQMFVGETTSPYNVKHYDLGGVLINSASNAKANDARMQRAGHHSLLIGTDQEGGEVSRLGYNPSRYPSPQAAYRRGGMKGIYRAYNYSAKQLHRRGINWNFAPDADVATPGSYMYFRAFGKGPKKTAQYIRNAVPAIQRNHVAATLKHFPGYGSESGDTDYSVVHSNRSLNHLEHYDFIPFRAGVKSGTDSIMVTNIILNKVQRGVPATLSRRDINLIRNQFHFNGVVVTDALDANSIQSYSRAHHNILPDYLAIKAGNDMIMDTDFRSAIPKLVRCVKDGLLSKKQINTSVARILTMKHKLGLRY